MILDFIVKGQELIRNGSELIVSDTIDYLTAHFRFSGAWAGLTKHAMFEKGTDVYDVTLSDDSIIESDHLNLADGTWLLSVVGVEITDAVVTQRITTQQIELSVTESGNTSGEPFPPSIGDAIYLNINQTTPQTIIDGVPLLASDRTIDSDYQITDKKYVDDKVATVTADDFNHNDLANKQGGTTGQYYHVTAAEKTVIQNTSGTNTGDQDVSGAISTHNTDAAAHAILARKTETMRLLISRTIGAGENVSAITWTQDDAGNALALIDAEVRVYVPSNSIAVGTSGAIRLRINNVAGSTDYQSGSSSASSIIAAYFRTVYGVSSLWIKKVNLRMSTFLSAELDDGTTQSVQQVSSCCRFDSDKINSIYLFLFASGLTYIPEGTVIQVYGRTA